MSDELPHYALFTAPFGDDEYPFQMGWKEANLWEIEREKSLMETFTHSVGTRSMLLRDVREVIRIGLIGGGMLPADAVKKVKRYVEKRPVGECLELALAVMESALFGSQEYQARKNPN